MLLGVNIDHIATLRNARGESYPSVIEGATICMKVGANGITAHLREDRRHIKDEDIFSLKKLGCRLNMEMAATEEMQRIALETLPDACCIVPEKRMEITTEGGLDVDSNLDYMIDFVSPLVKSGILVSLFIDADMKEVQAARKTGCQYIELHTGAFANAFGRENENVEFQKLKLVADFAHDLGLKVNAGHGLNYDNVFRMHEISCIEELNIGHRIISRALFSGLENAVKDMIELIK